MLTEAKLDELRKLQAYCGVLLDAHAVLAEKPPEVRAEVKVDLNAWRTSQSNRVLAGSGDKAALLGTLSTVATLTKEDLTKLDVYPSLADEILAAAADCRAQALALRAPVAVPKEIVR